jgi:hypothetical protein
MLVSSGRENTPPVSICPRVISISLIKKAVLLTPSSLIAKYLVTSGSSGVKVNNSLNIKNEWIH